MINVDDLIGIPYKDLGRDPKKGLDCLGLAIEVEKRFGNTLPDVTSAHVSRKSRDPVQVRKDIETAAKTKAVIVNKANEEGDLILFNNCGVLAHTAVYLGNDQFIHCNVYGVHIERLSTFNVPIGRVYRWL